MVTVISKLTRLHETYRYTTHPWQCLEAELFIVSFISFAYALINVILIFVSTADDPKSGQYSEDEGWQFITLGDQVVTICRKIIQKKYHPQACYRSINGQGKIKFLKVREKSGKIDILKNSQRC